MYKTSLHTLQLDQGINTKIYVWLLHMYQGLFGFSPESLENIFVAPDIPILMMD